LNPLAKRTSRRHKKIARAGGEVFRRDATSEINPAHCAGFFVSK
jgi:hypothetical protein